jgi:hypothetical protein
MGGGGKPGIWHEKFAKLLLFDYLSFLNIKHLNYVFLVNLHLSDSKSEGLLIFFFAIHRAQIAIQFVKQLVKSNRDRIICVAPCVKFSETKNLSWVLGKNFAI